MSKPRLVQVSLAAIALSGWLGGSAVALEVPELLRAIEAVSGETSTPSSETSAEESSETTAEDANPGESTAAAGTVQPDTETRFACEVQNGQYTVTYQPRSQPGKVYPWATPSPMGGGWSSEARCMEISRRLEMYRPDGLLEMTTAIENGYNTVCVTTQKNSTCRIVFTVPPGQDPKLTRDRVFDNLAIADGGDSTQAVNTFAGGSDGLTDQLVNLGIEALGGARRSPSEAINLRPFLDRADGGTGSRLTAPSARPGRPLNPDRFR
ncbi:COP23 domain-containing protein [Geitlerinema sp. PCC 7407]|uniref:COP23 domain-containing protein n=1 Tax=Geitlerinema sp. PCC 7407 TaxID=1173025 RepID=UPI00029FF64B|nr:COP23 domain-containing protein [Geitlerinema sp. PCC 7407]AFY65569.1 hypothetical protein GEI7407_1072 [Geitlerinema sp. PCC 7407]